MTATVGALATAALLFAIGLVAINGWHWFAGFLSGQAAEWAQAIGSVVAILAAYKIGRGQIEADRTLEALKRQDDDARRLEVIQVLLERLGIQIVQIERELKAHRYPYFIDAEAIYLRDAIAPIKAVDLFQCPSTKLIRTLSLLPRSADLLVDSLASYRRAADGSSQEEEDRQLRGLSNSVTLIKSSLSSSIHVCREELASLTRLR